MPGKISVGSAAPSGSGSGITNATASTLASGATPTATVVGGVLQLGIPQGPPGLLSAIAPWAASTVYPQYTVVSYLGGLWQAPVGFTSGTTFSTANWTLIQPGPNIVTGLTGGTAGSLVYLKTPGVCANLDPAMRATLANAQMFYKHASGVYLQIQGGQVSGFTGLTGNYIMALRQPTSKTDTNVQFYAASDTTTYNALAPSNYQNYMEVGRTINSTDVVFNLSLGSVRFADISGATITTVQDKALTTGTYPYTNNASFQGGTNWAYPWGLWDGTPNPTYRFSPPNTSFNTGVTGAGVLEFQALQNSLRCATHKDVSFADGYSQAVIGKGDGVVSWCGWLHRLGGTVSAPVGVGVRFNLSATTTSRNFSVGYWGGTTTWVDCTDPTAGAQFDTTITGSVAFRVELDTIGNFVGARIYPLSQAATPPTDYTVWGWQNVVTAAGGVGPATSYGRVWVSDLGTSTGAYSAAPKGP